jgi:hypothetical protein
MPLEGSTQLIEEGWDFLESAPLSPISNSPSLEDLFEANRLHLTVNPLDMFRPTVPVVDHLTYQPMFPDWEQTLSPDQIDPSVPRDYTVSAWYSNPAEIPLTGAVGGDLPLDMESLLSPTASDRNLSDWIEADPFGDANPISVEAPIPTQDPQFNPESIFDAEPVMEDVNTFDPDFFFEVPSNVALLDSPAPDSLVGNGNVHPLLNPRGPEAFTPVGNPFLDPPPTYHYPQQSSSHQLFHPRPVPNSSAPHKLVRSELPELNFAPNSVLNHDEADEDFSAPFPAAWSSTDELGVTVSHNDGEASSEYPLASPVTGTEQCFFYGADHPRRAEVERQEARRLRRSQLFARLPRLIIPEYEPETFAPLPPRRYPPPLPPPRSRQVATEAPPSLPVMNPHPIPFEDLQSVPLANPWRVGYRNPWFVRPGVAWYQAIDPNTGQVVGYRYSHEQAMPSIFAPAAAPPAAMPLQPRPSAPGHRVLPAPQPARQPVVSRRRRPADEEIYGKHHGKHRKVVVVNGVGYRRVN